MKRQEPRLDLLPRLSSVIEVEKEHDACVKHGGEAKLQAQRGAALVEIVQKEDWILLAVRESSPVDPECKIHETLARGQRELTPTHRLLVRIAHLTLPLPRLSSLLLAPPISPRGRFHFTS